jgi:hypothetical protein
VHVQQPGVFSSVNVVGPLSVMRQVTLTGVIVRLATDPWGHGVRMAAVVGRASL